MTNAWPANDDAHHSRPVRGGDHRIGLVVPQEKARPMKRVLTFRNAAKGAGALVLGLIALDLVATVATLAFGATWFRR
jgi:hypothetical protein